MAIKACDGFTIKVKYGGNAGFCDKTKICGKTIKRRYMEKHGICDDLQ